MRPYQHQLDETKSLGYNWDGYGALAVFPEIANQAQEFLDSLDDDQVAGISDIYANPMGTISIEFQNNSQGKLMIEIGKNNYSYFVNYKDRQYFVNGTSSLDYFDGVKKDISDLLNNKELTFGSSKS